MLICRNILGSYCPHECPSTTVDYVDVDWMEANRRRLRRQTTCGSDLHISLDNDQYLFHGAIVYQNANNIVVVRRPEEISLVIDFDPDCPRPRLVRQVALIAHSFGNQHTPIEIYDLSVNVPLLSGLDVAIRTIEKLDLGTLSYRFDTIRLGALRPLTMSGHGHE